MTFYYRGLTLARMVDKKHRKMTLETRRRNALIPEGANSPKIQIDLSEHEYCGKQRTKTIDGVSIRAYSREMLVLEKLRAICQQHPDYPYPQQTKNRARDFYDIYSLTDDTSDEFIRRCQHHLKAVFDAKKVPLWTLRALWDDDKEERSATIGRCAACACQDAPGKMGRWMPAARYAGRNCNELI